MFKPAPGNVVAQDIPQRAINLPSFHDITSIEQARVTKVIRQCLNG